MTHLHFEAQIYNIIFTQRKSIKNFNRSLTILRSPRSPEGGQAGKRWWEVWEVWEVWERWEWWERVGAVGVNYVLWLGGGVFDFFAGLIHSLSDAALL